MDIKIHKKITMRIFFSCMAIFISGMVFSQSEYSISGQVFDSLTGETLIGATIQIEGADQQQNFLVKREIITARTYFV